MSSIMKEEVSAAGSEDMKKVAADEATIPTRGIASKVQAKKQPGQRSSTPPPRSIEDIFADIDAGEDMDDDDEGNEAQKDEISVPFTLNLQTDKAHKVWNGIPAKEENGLSKDRHRGYPGIRVFVTSIGRLCAAARQSDPYAFQALRNVEQHMSAMNKDLVNHLASMEATLDSNKQDGITFSDVPNRNYRPVEYPIVARNQYALTAATFVGRFDRIVRYALTARSYNQITRDQFKEINGLSSQFIRLTFMSLSFRYSGATVSDFLAENTRAREAFEKYGSVDADVLEADFQLHFMDLHPGRVVPQETHDADQGDS